jgi:hypothetical protein
MAGPGISEAASAGPPGPQWLAAGPVQERTAQSAARPLNDARNVATPRRMWPRHTEGAAFTPQPALENHRVAREPPSCRTTRPAAARTTLLPHNPPCRRTTRPAAARTTLPPRDPARFSRADLRPRRVPQPCRVSLVRRPVRTRKPRWSLQFPPPPPRSARRPMNVNPGRTHEHQCHIHRGDGWLAGVRAYGLPGQRRPGA